MNSTDKFIHGFMSKLWWCFVAKCNLNCFLLSGRKLEGGWRVVATQIKTLRCIIFRFAFMNSFDIGFPEQGDTCLRSLPASPSWAIKGLSNL